MRIANSVARSVLMSIGSLDGNLKQEIGRRTMTTNWVLTLSLTDRPSSQKNTNADSSEKQLNYYWNIFNQSPCSTLPIVMKVNDTLAIQLQKGGFGPNKTAVLSTVQDSNPPTLEMIQIGTGKNPLPDLSNTTGANFRDNGWWWPASPSPGNFPIAQPNYAFRFKLKVTVPEQGDYIVDPEMVVEPTGPPEPYEPNG